VIDGESRVMKHEGNQSHLDKNRAWLYWEWYAQ